MHLRRNRRESMGLVCGHKIKKIPITGKLIQGKAQILSIQLGENEEFAGSKGWLNRWVKRYNVKAVILSGESAEVPQTVDDWAKCLPDICEGYSPNDIFNADETSIYYMTFPIKSMVQKGEPMSGVKIAKERITVKLCCNASGEKFDHS